MTDAAGSRNRKRGGRGNAGSHAICGRRQPQSLPAPVGHELGRQNRASYDVTHRAAYAYVTGTLADGEQLPLCRQRYGGSASIWGFSIYRASHHGQSNMSIFRSSPVRFTRWSV